FRVPVRWSARRRSLCQEIAVDGSRRNEGAAGRPTRIRGTCAAARPIMVSSAVRRRALCAAVLVLSAACGIAGCDSPVAPADARRPPLISLTAGSQHTCVADETGSAWCWGRGGEGQLGNLASKDRSEPVRVAGPSLYV